MLGKSNHAARDSVARVVSSGDFVRLAGAVVGAAASVPGRAKTRRARRAAACGGAGSGHGGQDSGAICGTVLEKDLALDVALRAELLLRAAGFATVLTRTDDRYVSLADRVSLGNGADNSLFVSIHFNDGERPTISGVETYYAPQAAGFTAGSLCLAALSPAGRVHSADRAKRKPGQLHPDRSGEADAGAEPRDQAASSFMLLPMCGIRPPLWKAAS